MLDDVAQFCVEEAALLLNTQRAAQKIAAGTGQVTPSELSPHEELGRRHELLMRGLET